MVKGSERRTRRGWGRATPPTHNTPEQGAVPRFRPRAWSKARQGRSSLRGYGERAPYNGYL